VTPDKDKEVVIVTTTVVGVATVPYQRCGYTGPSALPVRIAVDDRGWCTAGRPWS